MHPRSALRLQIDADELYERMRFLGHKCRKVDCEMMIWEIDENSDKMLDWEEFKLGFACPLPNARSAMNLLTRRPDPQVLPCQG